MDAGHCWEAGHADLLLAKIEVARYLVISHRPKTRGLELALVHDLRAARMEPAARGWVDGRGDIADDDFTLDVLVRIRDRDRRDQ